MNNEMRWRTFRKKVKEQFNEVDLSDPVLVYYKGFMFTQQGDIFKYIVEGTSLLFSYRVREPLIENCKYENMLKLMEIIEESEEK